MNTKTGARKTYSTDFIEQLKAKLSEAPEVIKVRELTASEAVKEMAKEIHAMQNKGYTLAMILEMLKANNVNVSLATLKSAIAGTKAKKKASTKNKPVQQDLLTDATATEDKTTTRPVSAVPAQAAKKSAIFANEIEPDSTI
jgi:DNA-binding transcriptional MerR regulator